MFWSGGLKQRILRHGCFVRVVVVSTSPFPQYAYKPSSDDIYAYLDITYNKDSAYWWCAR